MTWYQTRDLILFILGLIAAPIIVAAVLLYYAGLLLWGISFVVAWVSLFLARDVVLYLAGNSFNEITELIAIVIWRIVLPLSLFTGCSFAVYSQLARLDHFISWQLALLLALAAGGLVLFQYRYVWNMTTLRHSSWARFLAAEIKWRTRFQFAQIERRFRRRLHV